MLRRLVHISSRHGCGAIRFHLASHDLIVPGASRRRIVYRCGSAGPKCQASSKPRPALPSRSLPMDGTSWARATLRSAQAEAESHFHRCYHRLRTNRNPEQGSATRAKATEAPRPASVPIRQPGPSRAPARDRGRYWPTVEPSVLPGRLRGLVKCSLQCGSFPQPLNRHPTCHYLAFVAAIRWTRCGAPLFPCAIVRSAFAE